MQIAKTYGDFKTHKDMQRLVVTIVDYLHERICTQCFLGTMFKETWKFLFLSNITITLQESLIKRCLLVD